MRWNRVALLIVALIPTGARAQEAFKIEVLKEAPPAELSGAIKGALNAQGYRVLDGTGSAYADLWLCKSTPASGPPAGSKGAIQFPVLAEGELLGAIRYAVDGQDYRDQLIVPGVYTFRFGLQPVNGDHLGVSPYRDYALLVPAAKDTATAPLTAKKLQEQSAEAAGTTHPAVLMLLAAPESAAKAGPTMVHDDALETWGAVVPLSLAVKGADAPATLPVRLILVGAALP